MTTVQLVQKDSGLIKAFRLFRKRYLSMGKKPDVTKLIPEVVYHTMRLEGEMVTRKEIQALFK